jgi:hypothetical protein
MAWPLRPILRRLVSCRSARLLAYRLHVTRQAQAAEPRPHPDGSARQARRHPRCSTFPFPSADGRMLILSHYTGFNADQRLLVLHCHRIHARISAPVRQPARAATQQGVGDFGRLPLSLSTFSRQCLNVVVFDTIILRDDRLLSAYPTAGLDHYPIQRKTSPRLRGERMSGLSRV